MPRDLPDRPAFFARHRALPARAVAATVGRDHWTACPESPSRSVPSAAFGDFHGSAANQAAGATLCDPAFVTGRFATLLSRRPVPTEESAHA